MCNDHPLRPSHGGSIAILRPPESLLNTPQSSQPSPEIRVLFSNPPSNSQTSGTQVHLHGLVPHHHHPLSLSSSTGSNHRLIIHHDGDLGNANKEVIRLMEEEVFLSFRVGVGEGGDCVVKLARRLKMKVGEGGIVGRRVSMVEGGGRVVGVGVVGWN